MFVIHANPLIHCIPVVLWEVLILKNFALLLSNWQEVISIEIVDNYDFYGYKHQVGLHHRLQKIGKCLSTCCTSLTYDELNNKITTNMFSYLFINTEYPVENTYNTLICSFFIVLVPIHIHIITWGTMTVARPSPNGVYLAFQTGTAVFRDRSGLAVWVEMSWNLTKQSCNESRLHWIKKKF